jgi:hypothetical protein
MGENKRGPETEGARMQSGAPLSVASPDVVARLVGMFSACRQLRYKNLHVGDRLFPSSSSFVAEVLLVFPTSDAGKIVIPPFDGRRVFLSFSA